ncbi:MAG: response regulator [Oscillospiraceae bacterium]|nr:response regulator [Oscillospiraceae bacterium]
MKEKILVVEDERNIAELIRLYLEKEGFEVIHAPDGGAGIAEFERTAPDLVLLDIMLPVMDGWRRLFVQQRPVLAEKGYVPRVHASVPGGRDL